LSVYDIGIDIIEVKRIKSTILNFPGFLSRVYTKSEIDYCEAKRVNRYICYSERFAAKEAISKSLRCGIGKEMFFNEIEILSTPSGAPTVKLYGRAKNYFSKIGGNKIKISLSGTNQNAIAFAISLV
jgi:holo-[acyl-carrier protein] synthase